MAEIPSPVVGGKPAFEDISHPLLDYPPKKFQRYFRVLDKNGYVLSAPQNIADTLAGGRPVAGYPNFGLRGVAARRFHLFAAHKNSKAGSWAGYAQAGLAVMVEVPPSKADRVDRQLRRVLIHLIKGGLVGHTGDNMKALGVGQRH